MLSDPIKFFDGLIRGIVLTFYDVVVLSVASLVFPFVRNTKLFWPALLSINRRVSSLTLLLIWLFAFFTLAANDLPELVARVASNRDTGSKPLQIVSAALIGTVVADIALRAICLKIKSPIRRSLYRELLRIAVAGAFFFASGVMLVGENSWLFSRLANLMSATFLGLPDATWKLFLPGASICIIAAKGFGIRSRVKRVVVALLLAGIVPLIVVGGPAIAGMLLQGQLRPLVTQREPTLIVQSDTQCALTKATKDLPSKLKVTTFLKLDGDFEKSAVLPLSKLVVQRKDEDGITTGSVGNFENDDSKVILSNSAFARFEFIVEFEPEGNEPVASEAQFECQLALLGGGIFGGNRGIENRTVKHWQ